MGDWWFGDNSFWKWLTGPVSVIGEVIGYWQYGDRPNELGRELYDDLAARYGARFTAVNADRATWSNARGNELQILYTAAEIQNSSFITAKARLLGAYMSPTLRNNELDFHLTGTNWVNGDLKFSGYSLMEDGTTQNKTFNFMQLTDKGLIATDKKDAMGAQVNQEYQLYMAALEEQRVTGQNPDVSWMANFDVLNDADLKLVYYFESGGVRYNLMNRDIRKDSIGMAQDVRNFLDLKEKNLGYLTVYDNMLMDQMAGLAAYQNPALAGSSSPGCPTEQGNVKYYTEGAGAGCSSVPNQYNHKDKLPKWAGSEEYQKAMDLFSKKYAKQMTDHPTAAANTLYAGAVADVRGEMAMHPTGWSSEMLANVDGYLSNQTIQNQLKNRYGSAAYQDAMNKFAANYYLSWASNNDADSKELFKNSVRRTWAFILNSAYTSTTADFNSSLEIMSRYYTNSALESVLNQFAVPKGNLSGTGDLFDKIMSLDPQMKEDLLKYTYQKRAAGLETKTWNDYVTDSAKEEANYYQNIKNAAAVQKFSTAQEWKWYKEDREKFIFDLVLKKGLPLAVGVELLSKLNFLTNDEMGLNEANNLWSDRNQRNNKTEINGTKIGDSMCFPTSIAIMLSDLGEGNPVAALGIQYEDFLQKILNNDPEIKATSTDPTKVQQTFQAEQMLIRKYFGDKIQSESTGDWYLPNYDNTASAVSVAAKYKNDMKSKLQQGWKVVLNTQLTAAGHLVTLDSVVDNGVYINDPYGNPKHDDGTFGYNDTNKNGTQVTSAGAKYFLTWDQVLQFKIGDFYNAYRKK